MWERSFGGAVTTLGALFLILHSPSHILLSHTPSPFSLSPLLSFTLSLPLFLSLPSPSLLLQGKCEWESDSGRMLTLTDVEMNTLSQMELLAFQRVAINQLQAMNIPVSHALVTGKSDPCCLML